MSYFNVCPHCGAFLDPGEHCDCDEEELHEEERRSGSAPMISRTLNRNPRSNMKALREFTNHYSI